MRCGICNIDAASHEATRWGPEFAHKTCVVAFNAGKLNEREACEQVCHEIELDARANIIDTADEWQQGAAEAARECWKAIRMRSNA